jgi:hypothetical protein
MNNKSILQTVFLWCEIVVSARILLFTIPVAGVDLVKHSGVLAKSPMVLILSLLAILFIVAGVAGLRNRPTTKFLHLAAGLATLIIALVMTSFGASCPMKADLLPLGLGLYALVVIYLFVFKFKAKAA